VLALRFDKETAWLATKLVDSINELESKTIGVVVLYQAFEFDSSSVFQIISAVFVETLELMLEMTGAVVSGVNVVKEDSVEVALLPDESSELTMK
jgi:hypothetical protein